MYKKLESNKNWRIFKKASSIILLLTFTISFVFPIESLASESPNYRLSNFTTQGGKKKAGTTYNMEFCTFGESINGDFESSNIKTKTGFIHTIIEEKLSPPLPPQGTDIFAESANFQLKSHLLSIADIEASSSNLKLSLACVGEAVNGIFENYYDKIFSGHIYTILANSPILTQPIPSQSWQTNTTNDNAFDLDDYITDPDGDDLTFEVSGNKDITITIDPDNHQVSFSQATNFTGSEEIIIAVIDSEGNRTSTNSITLNVYNTISGLNNAPVLDFIPDIGAKEGELIKISPQAFDPDGDPITYTFTPPFNNQGIWQTDYQSAGAYNIIVTASDGKLTDTQEVKVTVLNLNRKPRLNYIPDITSPENQIITLTPEASDPDNDDLTYTFSPPFNSQGQWKPTYSDSGVYTITVTVSDGNLNDSQDVLINITDVNTDPKVKISQETINPAVNQEFSFIITAEDDDGDPLTLILEKDGSQFYSGNIYEFYLGIISFSTLGTHTIKAIVQDTHGAQAQAISNVEVIDPKQLWNKILPLLGDFNGDGLVDIGTYNRNTGRWAVALSNFSGFGSISEWLTDFGTSTDYQYVNGDFNGDGLTDIATFNQSTGEWHVGISDGTSFINQDIWSTFSAPSSGCLPLTGDFNGDGISDIGVYNKSNGDLTCAISDKTSFISPTPWITNLPHSNKAQPFSGDFNGDSLTDIGIFDNGSWCFALSTGTNFISKSEWNFSFGSDKTPVISDFNNDSFTDIGIFKKDSGNWEIYHSTGNGFVHKGEWLTNFGQGEYNTPYALDFNGDGLTDAAVFDNYNFRWQRLAAQGKVANLLQKISNTLGGTTEITYKSSVYYDNTGDDDQSDLPFAMQTVTQVKQGDGLGNFYKTSYAYANGLYAFHERETRGFGYVKVIDNEGSISETYFHQDDIFKGLPYKAKVSDSSGNFYLKTEKVYAHTTPYPNCTFAYLQEEEASSYDGQITPRTTKTTYKYDQYGNPIKTRYLGDVNIAGDEKELYIEYVYNTDLWILGLPARTYLFNAQGQMVNQSWFYYDNHQDYTAIPTKGNLTKEESWLDTTGKTNPYTQNSYDEYGNIVSTTDARGNTTTIIYDSATFTYPEIITNALGHTINNTYDPTTGQILTSTDSNGQTTRNAYDTFGHLIQVIGPNDNATHPSIWHEYDLTTVPAKITTSIREEYNTDDLSMVRTTYTFIDGLGRTIQTKTDADDPTKQIMDVVTFNSKGEIEYKYLPYFTNKTSEYTPPDLNQYKATYVYDCLGRLIKQTNPDLTYSTIEYAPGITTITDEKGHKIRRHQDVYSQTIRIEEFNQGKTYTTIYTYDAQGNLTKTIDNQCNTTSIKYDSLARKTSMDDPDMGHWEYDYDLNGNLIEQTDAKGQIIKFKYDAINRLTMKTLIPPNDPLSSRTVTYYYDDLNKSYCIGRLSKIIDSSGQTEFFNDNLGRETKTIKTIDDQNYPVERSYDALDRLKTLTYPDGEVVHYTYSPSGGIKSIQGNQNYVSNVTYTASGQMSTITYGNNNHADYEYYPQTLRLKHLSTNDGALQDLSYKFDNVGNITSITDKCYSATQWFSYDDLNRLTQAIGQTYGIKTYRYDSIGNILEKDGMSYTYGENSAGPHAVTSLTNSQNGKQVNLTYDANGNMLTKGNQTFQCDIENRLIKASGPIKQSTSTTFDLILSSGWNFISLPLIPNDESISAVFSSLTFGQDYDQVSRYNPDTQDFDHYNNTSFNQFDTLEYMRGYIVYVPNSDDIILTIKGTFDLSPLTYHLREGWNLIGTPSTKEITVTEALKNLKKDIDFDIIARYNKDTQLFENLSNEDLLNPGEAYYLHCLKDTTWQIQPASIEKTTEFVYDGDGGRVMKTITTTGVIDDLSAKKQTTIYLGSLYEAQSTNNEVQTTKHIFAGSIRICSINHKQSTIDYHYYHPDHLGSSAVITDKSGNLVQHLEYLPYGQTQVSTGTDSVTHKFTGKELDASTGLYYFGARYYDAELGRFITADPIVQHPYDPQTFNRYTYCRNNPLKYVDPTGYGIWNKIKKWAGKIAGAIVGFATLILGGGPAAAFAAFNLADTLISGGQAIYYGANPGRVIGTIGLSLFLNRSIPIPQYSSLGLQVGLGAMRGAIISTATTAALNKGRGKLGTAAGAGAAMGAVTGFFGSEQFQNVIRGEGFLSNRQVALNRLELMIDSGEIRVEDLVMYMNDPGTDPTIKGVMGEAVSKSKNGSLRGLYYEAQYEGEVDVTLFNKIRCEKMPVSGQVTNLPEGAKLRLSVGFKKIVPVDIKQPNLQVYGTLSFVGRVGTAVHIDNSLSVGNRGYIFRGGGR